MNQTNKSDSSTKIVIFDVDDILWALNRKMTAMTGIDYDKLVVYSILENELLPEEDRKNAYAVYTGHELFENIEWYDGIERINKLNADVRINSNSLNEKAAEMKREQLKSVLTLTDDKILIHNVKDEKKKKIIDGAFILVDDSPYNIASSTAKYNIVLKQPWNSSPEMEKMMRQNGTGFIYCDSLNQIIDLIEMLLSNERRPWSC